MDGWQYALALVLGLFVTGNYGAGDRRRDPARLLIGPAHECADLASRSAFAPRGD